MGHEIHVHGFCPLPNRSSPPTHPSTLLPCCGLAARRPCVCQASHDTHVIDGKFVGAWSACSAKMDRETCQFAHRLPSQQKRRWRGEKTADGERREGKDPPLPPSNSCGATSCPAASCTAAFHPPSFHFLPIFLPLKLIEGVGNIFFVVTSNS